MSENVHRPIVAHHGEIASDSFEGDVLLASPAAPAYGTAARPEHIASLLRPDPRRVLRAGDVPGPRPQP